MRIRDVLTVILILITILYTGVKAQEVDSEFPVLKGLYFGQKVPGFNPEQFANGIVNTPMGMHGNIVFSPDLKEACWHPDEPKGLYCSENKDGYWTKPHEISFVENYMHDAPCYSHDGKKLFFIAGNIGSQGKTENEKFYFVERRKNGWSKPNQLSPIFDVFNIHWQFSLDQEDGLYFGGKIEGSNEKGDIWY